MTSNSLCVGFCILLVTVSSAFCKVSNEERLSKLEAQLEKVTSELNDIKKQCACQQGDNSSNAAMAKSRETRATDPFVAFAATIISDMTPLAANEVIIFDNVYTKVGGGYDPFIGRFQAPVAGYYHFVVTIISYQSHFIEIELIRDGSMLCRARASQTYNAMGACASNVHLNVGSDVWVRHRSSVGDYIRGSYFPSFTGHLIKAD
ncbi:complement C1q tumor necrosis factor-related protein 4-like [Mizuhopecten yessoensis]|uniref:Heavy metal-binding protein HIP n=1 Tax=Mizuhopecten yessoensis TaxID=6573 RepID=A0A210QVQ1_MIZYE|nr:complement C1q tumor necrosis factor-related protein 4-like [Mizuhopecten yessoensis]OWF52830.1 Heavy metal-binding protein HIP [Mizuhopecten yessoensis]